MSAVRSLIDGPCSGCRNMAVDEVVLTAAIEHQITSVRIYQWVVPTVSLGHFQSPDDPVLEERFPNLLRVRRLSGGGAILHDAEVTYSCSVPSTHPLTREPTQLYVVVHEAIIEVLRECNVLATMRGTALNEPEPFLCFGRGDPRDIVIGRDKIVGSAQRRRSGAILQHGAILLKASRHATEFPGIEELTGQRIDRERLSARLSEKIAAVIFPPEFEVTSRETGLTEEEELLVRDWAAARYEVDKRR